MSTETYSDRLVFLDLETTGLDPINDHILEVGFVLVDRDLRYIDEYSEILYQPDLVLEGMNEWCRTTHERTGLTKAVRAASPAFDGNDDVAITLLATLRSEWGLPEKKCPMVGCSVHFDRAFLRSWMPYVEAFFHYGNIDVSSIGRAVRMWLPEYPSWPEKEAHRVTPDNFDAIEELAHYRNAIREHACGALGCPLPELA